MLIQFNKQKLIYHTICVQVKKCICVWLGGGSLIIISWTSKTVLVNINIFISYILYICLLISVYLYFIFISVYALQSNFYRSVPNYDFIKDTVNPFFQLGIDSFCKMCITSALAHRQHWKTLQHGIVFSIISFVRHLKSKLSQPLLQPPSLAQQTLFSLAAGMLTIRGGQIKLPNESRLVSIYVSSAGNTNSLKKCQSLQVGICLCKYCLS